MDKPEFNALINDILAAYLDKASTRELAGIIAKYGVFFGDDIFDQADAEIKKSILEGRSHHIFNEANRERLEWISITNLVQEYGAIPGKDISKYGDGVLISPELLDKIVADFPPGMIDKMRGQGTLQDSIQNPYELLEKDLGVPFFDSIEALAKLRIETMTNAYAIHYLNILIRALSDRHPWLMSDGFPYRFMVSVCGERLKELVNEASVLTADFDPGSFSMMALEDVFTALGKPGRTYDPETEDMIIRRTDMLALDKVWLTEDMRWAGIAENKGRD